MDISLSVLNPSDTAFRSNVDNLPGPGTRLECLVSLEQDLFRPTPFDTVAVTLRGRLKNQINTRVTTAEASPRVSDTAVY